MAQISPVPVNPLVSKDGRLTKEGRNWLAEVQRFITVMPPMFRGSGSPNGQIFASPPALYVNTAGGAGTTLWVKESGTATNTGWVGK
jgi:hypothetical protein